MLEDDIKQQKRRNQTADRNFQMNMNMNDSSIVMQPGQGSMIPQGYVQPQQQFGGPMNHARSS